MHSFIVMIQWWFQTPSQEGGAGGGGRGRGEGGGGGGRGGGEIVKDETIILGPIFW